MKVPDPIIRLFPYHIAYDFYANYLSSKKACKDEESFEKVMAELLDGLISSKKACNLNVSLITYVMIVIEDERGDNEEDRIYIQFTKAAICWAIINELHEL